MKCIVITVIAIALVLLLIIGGIVVVVLGAVVSVSRYGSEITDSRVFERMQIDLNPSFIPQWSADGTYIVFNPQNKTDGRTFVVDSKGMDLRALLEYEGRYDGSDSPQISPDGTEVVYSTLRHVTEFESGGRTRNYEIEKSKLDGSDRRRLTNNRMLDASPSWSSDGRRIAFARETGDETGIYTMNSDGSNEHLIFPFRISEETASGETYRFALDHLTGPIWSLDGEFIAFSVKEPNHVKNPGNKQDLYIARSDGSWSRKVLSQLTLGQKKPISIPSWSPKDEMLAFAVNSQAENTVYVIRPIVQSQPRFWKLCRRPTSLVS